MTESAGYKRELLREELLSAWWRLQQLPGVGRVTLSEVRQQLGDPNQLLSCTANDLIQLGLKPEAAQRWQQDSNLLKGFSELQRWQSNKGCGVLLAGVAPYPESLSALRDAPTILYYQGDLECLSKPMIAMVGSRQPSDYAQRWAQQCAQELASTGITVVSGLALGIDALAHEGALASGRTIAVLGSGLDVVYPQRHVGLAQMIAQQGLLLSEFSPGTEPQARHFPSRNRIISGLSQATVVVEAALKSGSLITARQAAEQGRDVFALPGLVTNPLSHGCHQLIRDGAYLVQSSQDVLMELGLTATQEPILNQAMAGISSEAPPQLPLEETPALVTHVDFEMTSTDVIAIRSRLDMYQLLPQLMELELDGWLAQIPGGYRRLR